MYKKPYASTILALSLMFILSGCFWNNDKKDNAVEKDPVYSQQDTSLNVIDKDNSNQETKEKANKGTENNPTEAKDKNKDIVKKPDILSNENPTKITSNDNTSQIQEEEKNDNTSQTQEEEKTKSEDVVTETVIKVKPSETNRESKKENNVKNKVDKKEKIVVTKPDKKSENKDKKNKEDKEIKTTKPSNNGKSEKEKPIENKNPDVVKPNKPNKTKPENKEPDVVKPNKPDETKPENKKDVVKPDKPDETKPENKKPDVVKPNKPDETKPVSYPANSVTVGNHSITWVYWKNVTGSAWWEGSESAATGVQDAVDKEANHWVNIMTQDNLFSINGSNNLWVAAHSYNSPGKQIYHIPKEVIITDRHGVSATYTYIDRAKTYNYIGTGTYGSNDVFIQTSRPDGVNILHYRLSKRLN